jgi:hypothetical protein
MDLDLWFTFGKEVVDLDIGVGYGFYFIIFSDWR